VSEPAAPATSHKEILRSTSIIGVASVINIVISIVRTKILALLVGPAGVGLMGLFNRVLGTAITLAGMGLGHSGVRQIAAASAKTAEGDVAASASAATDLARVRQALWFANLGLGLVAMVAVWLFREPIAAAALDDASRASEVGWLGVGVFFALVSASQTALLQGLRRIADLAKVTILGTFVGSAVGVVLVWQLGVAGIVWMLIAAPAASALVAAERVARLPRPIRLPLHWPALTREWRVMFDLGAPIMAATLVTGICQLVTRSSITDALGIEATGHFEAAWSISMTYVGLVLAAMSTDYYPRLTAAITDRSASNRLANEQAEVALLLAVPVLLGLITFAPLVTSLLYSSAFAPTTEILRLQVVGDILKVASWPMGFILLARGNNRLHLLTELGWNLVYLVTLWVLLPRIGLAASGVAFVAAYLVYLVTISLIVRRLQGFVPARRVVVHLLVAFVAALGVLALSYLDAWLALGVGILMTSMLGFYSSRMLLGMLGLGGRLGALIARIRRILRIR